MALVDVRRARQGMTRALDGFTTGQKAMMALATVAVVVGLFVFSRSGSGPSMVPLFSGLAAADASAIASQLDAQRVPYRLADNGSTVLVPQQDVYRLRIDMSAQGLPSGGNDGWSLIDGQGLTTSSFRQRIDYQRALSGELARTIGAIDGVEAAKVNLVIPDDDVFAADRRRASASVLVMTAQGRQLSSAQVRSIVNLVASAVPELTPDAVTVADASGTPLWMPATDGRGGGMLAGDDTTQRTIAFEQALGSQIEQMIARITGPGRATVKVRAELDFDERASVSEIRQAPNAEGEAPLVEERTTNTEQYTGAGQVPGGALGPDGAPTDPGTGDGATTYQNQSEAVRFALNKVTEEVRSAPGAVQRLSVAVAVDEAAVGADQLAQIQNLVAAAAGIDDQRGDLLTVERIPFDTSELDAAREELEAAARAARAGDTSNLVQSVLVVLLVLVVLFLSWRSLRKATRRAQAAEAIDLRALDAVREQLAPAASALPAGAASALGSGDGDGDGGLALPTGEGEVPAPAAPPEPEPVLLPPIPLSVAARTAEQIEGEIKLMIDQQAEDVAAVLRSWLGETKRVRR